MRFVAVMVIAMALPGAAAWAQEPAKQAPPEQRAVTRLPPIHITNPQQPAKRAPPPAPASAPAETVGSGPLTHDDIARDKVPANVTTLGPAELDPTRSTSLGEALVRRLPGVTLSDQTGNPFQPDINYRGFVASPVIGTPQGLAVY